ncbi:hypothetical protein W97_05090 [Coniosporium apollinis CBS 100218]|uniref:Heterokaryon incompatibility domain-containing protein n=1 Tax=Coniosporium apollinis (strain CBS 100218) TaxID=1168221 RepID=R7YVH3_CONA1|nr:uncharacterized protein W97_05090 [Coniosporium apollinis CBS 100218]EON65848.1 hypothetical protein W97_05090 [Coniosporium apollinis CBS 100218]
MHAVSLDDSNLRRFNALSYVWGKPVFDQLVIINGVEVRVTENLYLALRDLLRSATDASWWVDAVCINQANTEERGSQLQMMSRIFSSAAATVAHLGSFRPTPALSLLKTLATQYRQPGSLEWIVAAASNPEFVEGWKALVELLSVPYWSRAWILQETIVSLRLELFDPEGPWLDVWNLLYAVMYITLMKDYIEKALQDGPGVYLKNLDMVRNQLGMRFIYWPDETRRPLRLMTTLLNALRLKAMDPRDHLYALLAMTEDGLDIVGRPDYATPTSRVFASFVQSCYHRYGILDMILLSAYPRRLEGMPSWVPDLSSFEGQIYRNTIALENLLMLNSSTETPGVEDVAKQGGQRLPWEELRFKASGWLPRNAEFSTDLRILKVGGILLGNVTGLGGWVGVSVNERDYKFEANHPCEQQMDDPTQPFSMSRTTLLEAVAHSLTIGVLPNMTSAIPSGLLGQILIAMVHSVTEGKLSPQFLWALDSWWSGNKDLRIGHKALSLWLLADGQISERRTLELNQTLENMQVTAHGTSPANPEAILNIFLKRLIHVTFEMQRRLLVTQKGQLS